MQSRLLPTVGKVEASKLCEVSTRSLVICARGLFLGEKLTEPNRRGPFVSNSDYTFVSRCRAASFFTVAVILCGRCFAEIFSAIVETITISVIHCLTRFCLHEMTMKRKCSPNALAVRLPDVNRTSRSVFFASPIGHKIPTPPAHVRKIGLINFCEFSPREWNEFNAELARRRHARGSVSGGSNLTGAFSSARSLCRTRHRKGLAAHLARSLVQSHRSAPSTSSNRAPVVGTTRGYFSQVTMPRP
jgi:hypothetical protein